MAAKTYQLALTSTTLSQQIEAVATPSLSLDGRLRVVWGCDGLSRGVSATVTPLAADTQFVIHSIRVVATPSNTGPEDA